MNESKPLLHWKRRDGVANCYNRDNLFLGCLARERVGKWMHWCWYQKANVRMSPGCLQEVRDEQKHLKSVLG